MNFVSSLHHIRYITVFILAINCDSKKRSHIENLRISNALNQQILNNHFKFKNKIQWHHIMKGAGRIVINKYLITWAMSKFGDIITL